MCGSVQGSLYLSLREGLVVFLVNKAETETSASSVEVFMVVYICLSGRGW